MTHWTAPAPESLDDRLHALRKARGWTQAELGKRAGYARITVSEWETGLRRPSVDALIALADLYDVSIDWLLTGAERLRHESSK